MSTASRLRGSQPSPSRPQTTRSPMPSKVASDCLIDTRGVRRPPRALCVVLPSQGDRLPAVPLRMPSRVPVCASKCAIECASCAPFFACQSRLPLAFCLTHRKCFVPGSSPPGLSDITPGVCLQAVLSPRTHAHYLISPSCAALSFVENATTAPSRPVLAQPPISGPCAHALSGLFLLSRFKPTRLFLPCLEAIQPQSPVPHFRSTANLIPSSPSSPLPLFPLLCFDHYSPGPAPPIAKEDWPAILVLIFRPVHCNGFFPFHFPPFRTIFFLPILETPLLLLLFLLSFSAPLYHTPLTLLQPSRSLPHPVILVLAFLPSAPRDRPFSSFPVPAKHISDQPYRSLSPVLIHRPPGLRLFAASFCARSKCPPTKQPSRPPTVSVHGTDLRTLSLSLSGSGIISFSTLALHTYSAPLTDQSHFSIIVNPPLRPLLVCQRKAFLFDMPQRPSLPPPPQQAQYWILVLGDDENRGKTYFPAVLLFNSCSFFPFLRVSFLYIIVQFSSPALLFAPIHFALTL